METVSRENSRQGVRVPVVRLLILSAFLSTAFQTHAFAPLVGHADLRAATGEAFPVLWNLDLYPSGIPYLIQTDGNGEGTPDLPGDQEIALIRKGFENWQVVETSSISYQFISTTEYTGAPGQLRAGQVDNVNVVGFDTDSSWARAGVVALSIPVFRDGASSNSGQLIEADILLFDSPWIQWEASGEDRIRPYNDGVSEINLEKIVTREVGFFNGLQFSFVRAPFEAPVLLIEDGIIYLDHRRGPFSWTSLLYPYLLDGLQTGGGSASTGYLTPDEIAGISSLYPEFEKTTALGEIRGRVTLYDPEIATALPLCGAHLMAVEPGTYRPVVGTISQPDGTYSLSGLPAGEYLVWVEPSSPGDIENLYGEADVVEMGFYPEFYNDVYYPNREGASRIVVEVGGAASEINVQVVKRVPSREVIFARGGETDENGNRLVRKIEPDNTPGEATELSDDNHDDLLSIADTIQSAHDVDFYSFQAVRDDVWSIRAVAQSNGSRLVPRVRVYGPGPTGGLLADEVGTPGPGPGTPGTDPEALFTAPETGTYFVAVSDFADQGGAQFFYELRLERLSKRVPLSPLGPPVAVLSVPLSDADLLAAGLTDPTFGNVEIVQLQVQFIDVDGDGGLDTDGSDFLPPTLGGGLGTIDSGFSVFVDSGPVPGVFDLDPANPDQTVQDRSVRLLEAPTIESRGNLFEVTFTFDPLDPVRIPAQRVQDDMADFFVVVRPSLLFHHGDDFQAIIPKNGIRLRVNGTSGTVETTLFDEDFPEPSRRNKYTGDIVQPTSFIADGGASVPAKSIDFPILGLNLVGDPVENYWVSQIEVTFVGYSVANTIPFVEESFLGINLPKPLVDPRALRRTWEMTDLLPFSDGVTRSGGVNVYVDNDPPGDPNNGVPNFGLNGDLLVPFMGSQRFEVIPADEIPDEIIKDLYPQIYTGTVGNNTVFDVGQENAPPPSRAYLEQEEFLALRDQLNIFAFKAILPLAPNQALAVPADDQGANAGADLFITIRTSEKTEALDAFIPYIQVDGVKISTDLPDVLLAGGDLSAAAVVNAGSLRKIDPTTKPNTTAIEVRPEALVQFRDMVSPNDPENRGALIASEPEGAQPLAVIGIDAQDFGSDAMRTNNPQNADPDSPDFLNTGLVLDSLRVVIDPVDRPAQIPTNFIQPVQQTSLKDPDVLGVPLGGILLLVDDDTPAGNFLDDDFDGLFDEELLNESDDDLDGLTDEDDFGDEDEKGTSGQLDPSDDLVAYLHQNDIWRRAGSTSLAEPPVVTQQGGSLIIDFPNLLANVSAETAGDYTLASDPWSVFADDPFFRTDHFPISGVPQGTPAASNIQQNGFYMDFSGLYFANDGLLGDSPAFYSYSYSYYTQIPNNNAIPELRGPDFFVAARMGPGALSGDSFRMRIPAGGLQYSVYRDSSPNSQGLRPDSAPQLDFSSTTVRVGAGNTPPTLTFLQPSQGTNVAEVVQAEDGRVEFEFTVQFEFNDPDNDAVADFFFDTDNFGVDGEPIPFVEGQQTANIVDNDGQRPLEFTFRFPPELANSPNAEVFIYAIVTDDVNPPKAVYSNGTIVLDEQIRNQFVIQDFIIADNLGRLFGTGGANVNIPDLPQSRNIIRDIELTPSARGALFLNGFGEVVLRGDPDPWADFVRSSNVVTFPEGAAPNLGLDLARDIEPDFRRNGFYLLDAMGTVHPVGAVPPPEFPLVSSPIEIEDASELASVGNDFARDMELTSTGLGLYILRGSGQVTALGDAESMEFELLNFGFDLARDIALTPTGKGIYMLDGYGNIHVSGDANENLRNATDIPVFMGSDVYRAIEVVPNGAGLVVMDRQGQVYKSGDVVLGPNPVRDGTVPPPPGFREGENIDFTDQTKARGNVVTGEAPGAFIDLETVGLGGAARSVQELIQGGGGDVGSSTERVGLCQAIEREDLDALLSSFETRTLTNSTGGGEVVTRPGFLDAQGHDLDDFAANWKAFFDFFDVVSCRINPASTSVQLTSQTFDQGEVLVVSGSMEIIVLQPVLSVFAPADDPTAIDGEGDTFADIGETFTLGPIQFDQVIRFYEIDDGRGWRMKVIDDDFVEGQIDLADPLLARRDFRHLRTRRSREGLGTLFLSEEDGRNDSRNGEYLFQFFERSEDRTNSPEGGWHQPIVYVEWFDTVDDDLPYLTITVPFRFDVLRDTTTQATTFIGGDCATFGMLPTRADDQTTLTQDDSLDTRIDEPAGWRFFNPIGVYADANFVGLYDSHVFFEGPDTLRVPDEFSSASVVNLTALLNITGFEKLGPPVASAPPELPEIPMSRLLADPDFIVNPTQVAESPFASFLPLGADLKLNPEDLQTIPFSNFQSSDTIEFVDVTDASGTVIARAFTDDFLVTFRKDDQFGLPLSDSRLYYVTMRIKAVNPEEPNSRDNIVFVWRYEPAEDFIPFNAFKSQAADTIRNGKVPATGGDRIKPDQKPNFTASRP